MLMPCRLSLRSKLENPVGLKCSNRYHALALFSRCHTDIGPSKFIVMFQTRQISTAVTRLSLLGKKLNLEHFATTSKQIVNKKPIYVDEECEITATKKPTTVKLYPLQPKNVYTIPLICEELREKIWSMPPDCPPPCPAEPKICSRPLRRLKNRRKLQPVRCPVKPCPPPITCRADDNLELPPKRPLPCLVDNDCICIESKPPSNMNFKRMKKTTVVQKVPDCPVICEEEIINTKYVVKPKDLPVLKPPDCFPCVEETMKNCPKLKRLKARMFQPRPVICPVKCEEQEEVVVRHLVEKKVLPCLDLKCRCVEPPKPTPCCPIRRLPKVKVYEEQEECKEEPCKLMDDLCREQQQQQQPTKIQPLHKCLPSMILCAKHNSMSIKQFNLLKALGEVSSKKKVKGEC